jgi:hypothetical protein
MWHDFDFQPANKKSRPVMLEAYPIFDALPEGLGSLSQG